MKHPKAGQKMRPANKNSLLELAKDVNLSTRQVDQMTAYVELLEVWNTRTNLISRQDADRIVSRHVRESLWFCQPRVVKTARSVLDLGSGAGFPGLVMKIYLPALKMTLLDSRRMKAVFLQEAVARLGLQDTEIVCDRAENLARQAPPPEFDLITCRAVSKLEQLWAWAAPLLRTGGELAALKGGQMDAERMLFTRRFPKQEVITLDMPVLTHDPTAERKMVLIKRDE